MGNAVSRIEPVSEQQRAAWAAGPWDREAHAALLGREPFATQVEVSPPPGPAEPAETLRVVAWNVERGVRPRAAAALLRSAGAELALLSELDVGMARSGQRHAPREIARALGAGYAYGVEFLELGLGNDEERRVHAGERNEVGFHGNAIVSAHPLQRPELVRLETRGDWYGDARGEVRVGGRMALLATLPVGGVDVHVAVAHLDSHGDPEDRAAELGVLLAAIEARGPGAPALIGGDLNTLSVGRAELEDADAMRRALETDPGRFAEPFAHEPLFAVAERAGYGWRSANVLGAGTHRVPATNQRSALHLDWFLVRGLACQASETLEAVDSESGAALSDHEAISLSVRPAAGPGV